MNDGIREKVSRLLGVMIPEGRWVNHLEALDREGIPNRKQMIGLLLIICQTIEDLENKNVITNTTRRNTNTSLQSK
jgi:hypothetical protein